MIQLLASEFTRNFPGYEIEVPKKSIKHRGGIICAVQKWQLFGRSGRPLSVEDKIIFPTAREIPVAKIPLGFGVSTALSVNSLTFDQFKKIFSGKIFNWKEVGGIDRKIILLGREREESTFNAIMKSYPFFADTIFHKIYSKDHLIIRSIANVPGAVGFAAESSILAHKDLSILSVENFRADQEVGLIYDASNENNSTVELMKTFVQSKIWQNSLITHGFISLNNN